MFDFLVITICQSYFSFSNS